jgi:hypothetical protein
VRLGEKNWPCLGALVLLYLQTVYGDIHTSPTLFGNSWPSPLLGDINKYQNSTTVQEWDELQKNKKRRKKEKKAGIETISDIEGGEDGNVCEYSLSQLMADCGETAAL